MIASVRGRLGLSPEAQTQRVLTALEHPGIAMLAQPLVAEDARFELDFAAVARKAAQRGVALEVSLHPERIAPPDHYLESAKREGAHFVITSGASDADELDALRFSIGFARRAGLEPAQILNAAPLDALTTWLHDHRHWNRR